MRKERGRKREKMGAEKGGDDREEKTAGGERRSGRHLKNTQT